MAVLTRASAYPSWNSTVTSLAGELVQGGVIKLVSTLAPSRVFSLKVTTLNADSMVWEDGLPLGLFRGVRRFRVTPTASGGTEFAMAEVFSGLMLGLISKSLPDQRATFEAFARDLKSVVERTPTPA